MNDYPSVETLREWSARELMKWEPFAAISNDTTELYWVDRATRALVKQSDWQPDSPESPAKQILMVVEKMWEKGLYLELRNYDVDDEYRACFYTEETIFYENGVGRACEKSPCLAILKATWAAWRTRGNNQ